MSFRSFTEKPCLNNYPALLVFYIVSGQLYVELLQDTLTWYVLKIICIFIFFCSSIIIYYFQHFLFPDLQFCHMLMRQMLIETDWKTLWYVLAETILIRVMLVNTYRSIAGETFWRLFWQLYGNQSTYFLFKRRGLGFHVQ